MTCALNKPRRTTAIREAVGVFHDQVRFQAAIDELLSAGFDRSELSLLADERTIAEKLGYRFARVEELEDDPRVPRSAYVSTEAIGDAEGGVIGGLVYVGAVAAAGAILASGGTLAGAFLAAAMAGGAGGLVGAALAQLIGRHHAKRLQEHIDRSGLLLWVHVRDADHEARAREILGRHGDTDVHVHDLVAGTYLAANPEASDLERALLDPTAVFRAPEEVVGRADLSRDQKVAVLQRWAHDARGVEVAGEEGGSDLLSRVMDALRVVQAAPVRG